MIYNTLPTFESLPIGAFSSVFGDTTNSYKLYWSYATLDILKQEGFDDEIDAKDIAIRMIALAWYPVAVFKLSLGKQDQIGKTVQLIAEQLIIKQIKVEDDERPIEIYQKIKTLCAENSAVNTSINDFLRYVPFRFLSPFFADELRGLLDPKKNRLISKLSNESFLTSNPSIYKVSLAKKIMFHPVWLDYFKKHIGIIESYNLWYLVRYLESRNPNVQGISTKILPVQKRELKEAHKFWRIVLNQNEIECIYSNQELSLENKISIDHFVPWSFVAHDYLWNLSPTTASVNSSKSNNLPKLDLYLLKFTKLQYHAFNHVFKKNETKLLEDYVFLFQDSLKNISLLSENDFRLKLEKQIIPLTEIASNTGFKTNWICS